MKTMTMMAALLVLAACSAPEPETADAGDPAITCLMARGWAQDAQACRADPACIGSEKGAFDVEIWEGDVAAANQHFGCGIE